MVATADPAFASPEVKKGGQVMNVGCFPTSVMFDPCDWHNCSLTWLSTARIGVKTGGEFHAIDSVPKAGLAVNLMLVLRGV